MNSLVFLGTWIFNRRSSASSLFDSRGLGRNSRSVFYVGLLLALLIAAPVSVAAQGAGGAPTPTPAMPAQRRLIRPTLPPQASQADAGAQVYTLVCSACHGDRGQGLTDEWRATWNPNDQNCWQLKCHGPNHPSDGFALPRYAPPVVGPPVLDRFRTTLDLFEFIRQMMPWQEPASLQEDEYWDVTAFIVKLNGIDPGKDRLDSQRAAGLLLNPALTPSPVAARTTPMPPSRSVVATSEQSGGRVWWVIAIVLLIGSVLLLIVVRRPSRPRSH